MLIIMCFMLSVLSAQAASYSNSKNKAYTFTVPGGGISVIRIRADYQEIYKVSANQRTFTSRNKSALYRFGACSSIPYFALDNVTHSNGTVFNEWRNCALMYGDPWQGGICQENNTIRSYAMSSRITGTLHYRVMCDDALNRVQADSISCNLY